MSTNNLATFNYLPSFAEKDDSYWKFRLSAHDQTNINRLKNCSNYIYDCFDSTQIVILDWNYVNQSGPWYDLNASDTKYILMYVETSSAGNSCVYAYLEIKVPNSST